MLFVLCVCDRKMTKKQPKGAQNTLLIMNEKDNIGNRITVVALMLVLCFFTAGTVIAGDTARVNHRWNIGFDFRSPIHQPLLSVEYQFSPSFSLAVEGKKRLAIPFGEYSYSHEWQARLWESYMMKGYNLGVMLRYSKNKVKKGHFSMALEFTYGFMHLNNFTIINNSNYVYDITVGGNHKRYGKEIVNVFTRDIYTIDYLLFYGGEILRVYAGLGYRIFGEYKRSYHISPDYVIYNPAHQYRKYHKPVFLMGLRLGIPFKAFSKNN